MTLDLFSLDGKVALVTGASRGLGAATAAALAKAGAAVALHSNEQPATQTGAQNGTGPSATPSTDERPEILVGAAFLGGIVLAQVLKRLGSDD